MNTPVPTLLDVPVVNPLPASALDTAEAHPGSLVKAIAAEPDALVYFLLNVGDGDSQVLLLPTREGKPRRLVIVDIATRNKVPKLLDALHRVLPDEPIIEEPGTAGQVRLLVATHPHSDHIGGMADFLDRYPQEGFIDQFWEPGYFYPSPPFHNLMTCLEGRPEIRWLQPTAGTTLFLDTVKFTVIGPGVGLRNRFDTYGVNVNDASITLMVEYPATKVETEKDPANPRRINRRLVRRNTCRILLGADAQFTSWAQATVDFPDLEQEYNPVLARELRAATGTDYLKADLVKLSHHGSKHGVNIELLERVAAPTTLVSSQIGGGSYNFPHLLAMEAVREARQPTTTNRAERESDYELGVHVTGGSLETGEPLGSIAVVISRSPSTPPRLFRLCDRPGDGIELASARRCRPRP